MEAATVAVAAAVVAVADVEVDSAEAVVVVAEDSMVVAVAADQLRIRKIVLPPQILDFLLNCSSLLFWSSFLDILSNSPQTARCRITTAVRLIPSGVFSTV